MKKTEGCLREATVEHLLDGAVAKVGYDFGIERTDAVVFERSFGEASG